jgi:hypothetical protein
MPTALYHEFDKLAQVARLFNDGLFNSKRRLQAAQWQFDLKRRTLNHEVKVFNKDAAKHPHAPVVKAVEKSGNNSASSALLLRDDLIARIHESDQQHQENTAAILCELREMRRVSFSLTLRWPVFN